ncbi:MAG: SPOR domain-containing protein, partial [Nitrospinota bacterium]
GEFNDKQKWIEISVENIQIRREGNLIVASFIQKFKSNRINSMGRKTLYFERQGEEWKIKSETWNKDIPSLTHPYVVHIFSFNKRNAAIKTINYLRKEGFSAYESPFNLMDKGIWYRVFVDRFFSKSEAEEFAKSIIKRGYTDYAKELELPYAIETGIFESDGDAFKELLRLGEKGYSSYPLMVCDVDRCFYHILIGAYTNSEQAQPLSEELTNNGIQNKIVQP